MDFSSQGSIDEKLICHICLQLLTDPLSLNCGHNFCQVCITAKESVSHLEGQCRCPVCQSTYDPWNLLPNQQLGNIVKKIREANMCPPQQQRSNLCEQHGNDFQKTREANMWLPQQQRSNLCEQHGNDFQKTREANMWPPQQQKSNLCEQHGNDVQKTREANMWPPQQQRSNLCEQHGNDFQKTREANMWPPQQQRSNLCEQHGKDCHLFCKEDGKAICSLCVQEHQGHQISPVEEVVKECQEKLEAALDRLTQKQLEDEELEAVINEERATWKSHMQFETERIRKGFDEMRDIVVREKHRELQKLDDNEMHVLNNLAVVRDHVMQQKQYMRELISDLQHHMCESSVHMLQDMINTLKRSEICTLEKPKIVSKKLERTFRFPDLPQMLQVFKELAEAQSYWVNLMLNPLNMLSNIVISEDRRQVTVGNYFIFRNVYPCDFSSFDVLGSQNFSSGKYYWEVDVSKKIAWILGVYSKTSNLNRKKTSGFVFNPYANYPNAYTRFRPENGYWVIGLQNESEYNAFEDSSTSDPKVLTLFIAVAPHRVGVFIDYEASTVSFFNVTNNGSLIYKFSKCHFSQTVYPYFNPCNCPAPMTLCPPSS